MGLGTLRLLGSRIKFAHIFIGLIAYIHLVKQTFPLVTAGILVVVVVISDSSLFSNMIGVIIGGIKRIYFFRYAKHMVIRKRWDDLEMVRGNDFIAFDKDHISEKKVAIWINRFCKDDIEIYIKKQDELIEIVEKKLWSIEKLVENEI